MTTDPTAWEDGVDCLRAQVPTALYRKGSQQKETDFMQGFQAPAPCSSTLFTETPDPLLLLPTTLPIQFLSHRNSPLQKGEINMAPAGGVKA